jgi:DNA repair protein RadC
MARQLLKQFGSLRAMVEAPVIALLEVKGLKGAKAAQLIAAMEIARRISLPATRGQMVIKSTAMAVKYLRERLRGLAEEQFRVLYLNRRNVLLDDALIAQGSVDAVRPLLRNIVARALQVNASALIAAHNHPSGAAEPSESDRMLTQDLISGSRPLGLKVLDHVIVGEETTFSFADSGLLDELELLCLAPGESGRHSKLTKTTD